MISRSAKATWQGNLKKGYGNFKTVSGVIEHFYTAPSRFEKNTNTGSNPEEFLAAAHASCFAMALAHELDSAGHAPKKVSVKATVNLGKEADGYRIGTIDLMCQANVEGIDEATFQRIATEAKENCPISKALAGTNITLEATLES